MREKHVKTLTLEDTVDDFTVEMPNPKNLPARVETLDAYLQRVESIMREDGRHAYRKSLRATRGRKPREYLAESTKRVAELLEEIATLEDRLKHDYLMQEASPAGRFYLGLKHLVKGKRAHERMTMQEIILAQVERMRELTSLLDEQTSVYDALRHDLEGYREDITQRMNTLRDREKGLLQTYEEEKTVYAEGFKRLEDELGESDRLALTSQLKRLSRHIKRRKDEIERVRMDFLLLARKAEAVDTTISMLDGVYSAVDTAKRLAEDAVDYLDNMSGVYDTTALMGNYAAEVMNGLNRVNQVITTLAELNAKRFSALMEATRTYADNTPYESVLRIAEEPLREAEQLASVKQAITSEHIRDAIQQSEARLPDPDEL